MGRIIFNLATITLLIFGSVGFFSCEIRRCFLFGRRTERRVFGATYMTMVNPFFIVLDEGIREIVEAKGDKLITYDPANDQIRQMNQIQEFIELGVDAIFLNPVDWRLIKPSLESAKRAGIPVINVDTQVYDLNLVTSLVATDNVRAGELIAEDLMRRRGSARIAILDHLSAKSSIDRANAFITTLGNSEMYKVVARHSSEGDIEQAFIGMKNILSSEPRVDVVFATNDPSAMGAIAALDAVTAAGDILVYGIDGAPYAKKMIAEGRMTATAAQSPVEMGRIAATLAYQILNQQRVERTMLIEPFLIDSDFVVRYGIDGWQ